MKTLHKVAVAVSLALTACGAHPLNVKFVEPRIAQFKASGNRVAVAEGSLSGDVLAIEIMKNGKFVLASRAMTLPSSKPTPKPVAEAPKAADGTAATATATASAPSQASATTPAPTPEAPSTAAVDYIFRVNTITNFYSPGSNNYPATYSFAVTAKTGEIIYIKALTGADLKTEIAAIVGELAGILL